MLSQNTNNLHTSAYSGNYEVVKDAILKNKGALTAVDDSGRQLLHWAAVGGHDDLCTLLIEQGAPIDEKDELGYTPLICASSAGRTYIVRLLIAKEADVNAVNNGGHSSLQYAASKNHQEILSILLDNGSDINLADKLGETALHRAASKGNMACLRYLLDCNNCYIDPTNSEGNSPLHLACEEDNLDAARLLVQKGAKTDLMNKTGQIPTDLAKSFSRRSLDSS